MLPWWAWALVGTGGALLLVVLYDLLQTKDAILRNFPLVGHFRSVMIEQGPKLRQYIVARNDEERPFTRDQRDWIKRSAAKENNYFGFGTDNDLEQSPGYLILKQSNFPSHEPHAGDPDYDPTHPIECAKVLGGARERPKAFRPKSVFYVSAMSYGSLSARAVTSINTACGLTDTLHNTGEGGIAPHHGHGGELIFQIGTGYFGCRDANGNLDLDRLVATVEKFPVRAIELKLTQGAKPGRGGVLPAAKITKEISDIRHIPMGKDCISPASHTAFSSVDEMLDLVETIAERTGLPVGVKSAVGQIGFWEELATLMESGTRGVDFLTIDGGEGGTGAAPLVFSDHVSLPFKLGFTRVYRVFAERGLTDRVVFAGSGKLGFPHASVLAMAMGCDMIGVAREAMLAIGCIQAQECQTGHCPTGVATQDRRLQWGLDPRDKSAKLANYLVTLRKEVMWLARAAGVPHPSLVPLDDFEVLDDRLGSKSAREHFAYAEGWGLPPEPELVRLRRSRTD
ncbi:MAG: FMN-binding glutamate synthase family protein [Sandaracinaceae bacterium]|nr:FMN-binding glutamate synthase family protein [Sandaracinaceae bacterium]